MILPQLEVIHLSRDGLRAFLGPLELSIMEIIWQEGHITSTNLLAILRDRGRDIGHGTVQNTLVRMMSKYLIKRRVSSSRDQDASRNAYIYEATLTESELRTYALNRMMNFARKHFGAEIVNLYTMPAVNVDQGSRAKNRP